MASLIQYLKAVNRLRVGHTPVFLEYKAEFKPRWAVDGGNKHLSRLLADSQQTFDRNIQELLEFLEIVTAVQNGSASVQGINWENHFVPAFDALTLMWAAKRTKRKFVEVGSGNSTMFVRSALLMHNPGVVLTSIDPEPRAEIDRLCDTVIRQPLEALDLSIFSELQEGDTIFIDSSHRSFMNSDVTTVMLDVLPSVASGVLIGFHDIFLPFDYFQSWSSRGYNEQYLLACYILANPTYFDIQLANFWITKRRDHVAPLAPIWKMLGDKIRDRPASAFWGIKR